ncbi:MAG: glycine cleavage system aminomethyltransferase GcvT [Steroidobacteraceae bacterium]
MARRTPLFALHQSAGARIVDFGGWDMPLQYGSLLAEHHAVRRAAGLFDVSHMCVVDLEGEGVRPFLLKIFANDVGKLTAPGKALYGCLLNERGGVIDDLIVYYLSEQWFRVVVNAGTRDKDLAWIRRHAEPYGLRVRERTDLAMLAVQGPEARARLAALLPPPLAERALALGAFFGAELGRWFVSRTGYTGEDGFEVMVPAEEAETLWRSLVAAGVLPCGLGARDTLRLEAGMNLYGNDMDETTNPLESGLAWTVPLNTPRAFIGREALEAARARGLEHKLIGLVLEERGVLRSHQRVLAPGIGEGQITSGTFSPTLERSIALARIPIAAPDQVQVEVRGKLLAARVVKPPFVRHGQSLIG